MKTWDTSTCDDGNDIYSSTAFGSYFESLWIDIQNQSRVVDEENTSMEPNPYYSQKFIDYLRHTILPYVPILTRVMFAPNKDILEEDHQNPSEMWNRIIKHEEHGVHGEQKVGRFIRASHKVMLGELF